MHRAGQRTNLRVFLAVLLGCGALALASCASSDVAAVKNIPQGSTSDIRVTSVAVKIDTPRPNPQLQAALKSELENRLATCATGKTPHRVSVVINEFETQDVAKSILIGDEIELGGRVYFRNSATGRQAGEYYVKESFFWGGVLGAAMMSNAHRTLSQDFAKTVCKKIIGAKT